MLLKDVLNWLEKDFGYPVPEDYLDFLRKGDFESSWRKYYVIDSEDDSLEISDWFDYENLKLAYTSSLNEGIVEKYHLPIFDSCGMTVVIDCNKSGKTYGQIFARSQDGIYDDELDKNVYEDLEFVAISFSDIINNLKIQEDLEDMGIW